MPYRSGGRRLSRVGLARMQWMVRDSGQRLRALIACWRQHNDLLTTLIDMDEYRGEQISWISYSEIPEEEREDRCAITRTEFEEDSPLAMLPCGHYFHRDACIEWLERNSSCPICRRTVSEGSRQNEVTSPRVNVVLLPVRRGSTAPSSTPNSQ